MGQNIAIGFDFRGNLLHAEVIKLSNGLETEFHVNVLRDKIQGIRAQSFILELVNGKINLLNGNAFHDHELIRTFITKIEEHENISVGS